MHTIVLDDELVREAFKHSKTKLGTGRAGTPRVRGQSKTEGRSELDRYGGNQPELPLQNTARRAELSPYLVDTSVWIDFLRQNGHRAAERFRRIPDGGVSYGLCKPDLPGSITGAEVETSRRIGIAKGEFTIPEDIDQSNQVIARLFNGEISDDAPPA
ncbi:hypothetical protein ACWJKU_11605 [Methylocaldum sp. MU1018]